MSKLGSRIASKRHDRGLTQQELGLLAGASKAFISEIESGLKVPSLHKLVALANALGVSAGYLLGEGTLM